MHPLRTPAQAYRRVDFDARVAGAAPRELVLVCYDQLDQALARAVRCEQAQDNAGKSEALTRAVAAVAALQLGVDRAAPIAAALDQFYAAARKTLLDSVLAFDAAALRRLAGDARDIAAAFRAGQ